MSPLRAAKSSVRMTAREAARRPRIDAGLNLLKSPVDRDQAGHVALD
jgi:hypothetical protein